MSDSNKNGSAAAEIPPSSISLSASSLINNNKGDEKSTFTSANVASLTVSNNVLQGIPFDGTFFEIWKRKFLNLLKLKGLTGVLEKITAESLYEKVETVATRVVTPENEQKYAHVYLLLIISLSNDLNARYAYLPADDPIALWTALIKDFEISNIINVHAIKTELWKIKMGEKETLDEYCSRIQRMNNELLKVNQSQSQADLLLIMTLGLRKEFEETAKTLRLLGYDFMKAWNYLKAEKIEEQIRAVKLQEETKAENKAENVNFGYDRDRYGNNQSQTRGNSQNNNRFQYGNRGFNRGRRGGSRPYRGRGNHNNFNRGINTNENRNNNGNEMHQNARGRGRRFQWRRGRGRGFSNFNNGENRSNSNSNDYSGYTNDGINITNEHAKRIAAEEFIIDSGTTSHYTKDRNVFTNLTQIEVPITAAVANDGVIETTEIGDLKVQGEGKTNVILRDIRVTDNIGVNLLSVSKLTRNGAVWIFNDREALLVKNPRINYGEVLMRAPLINDLYRFRPQVLHERINYVEDEFKLMHHKLGHLNYQQVNELLFKNVLGDTNYIPRLKGIKDYQHENCEGCNAGKMHRKPFKNYSLKLEANDILQRIYTDLGGPVNITDQLDLYELFGKPKYASIIVDDYSGKYFGRVLTTKDQAVDHIIDFIHEEENQTGRTVKIINCDESGENRSSRLLKYLKERGIRINYTTKSTPQHNSVVERAMRTVFEMILAMLIHSKLHPVFWGFAFNVAIKLINYQLTNRNRYKTREELYSDSKPLLHNLKVFGCDATVFILKEDRGKLERKSMNCIFIGYDPKRENGYLFFNPQEKRIISSRDAKFYEDQFTFGRTTSVTMNDLIPRSMQSNANEFNVPFQFILDNPIPNNFQWRPVESKFDNEVKTMIQELPVSDSSSPSDIEGEIWEDNVSDEKKDENQIMVPSDIDHKYDSENETEKTEEDPIMTRTERRPGLRSHDQLKLPKERYELPYVNSQEIREYINLVNAGPKTIIEALDSVKSKEWKQAIDAEYESHMKNGSWTLVKPPSNANIIDSKWVLTEKLNEKGEVEKYKARLVAKGFKQIEGIDYFDTYAPVIRYKTFRLILALAARFKLKVFQFDAITAFLNAKVEEEIYMKQPESYVKDPSLVCKLNKAVYGIKQAPNLWNKTVNEYLLKKGFKRTISDPCLYYKTSNTGNLILLGLYVDDSFICVNQNDENEYNEFKTEFNKQFKIKDLGEAHWILGMKIQRNKSTGEYTLNQRTYIEKLIKKFNMEKAHPATTPELPSHKLSLDDCPSTEEEKTKMSNIPYRSLVGGLLYAAIGSRPDISHAVNVLTTYQLNPGIKHWIAAKQVLRYLKGTLDYELKYKAGTHYSSLDITSISDADWANDRADRKSISGYVVYVNHSPITWSSRKQSCVSQSTAEAEYIAMSETIKEAKWVCGLLGELKVKCIRAIQHFTDNQAAMSISEKDSQHNKSKHIDIKYHFIKEEIKNGNVRINYINTRDNVADIFTKALSGPRFEHLSKKLFD